MDESEEAHVTVDEMPDEMRGTTLGAVRFDALSPTDFEEFCFDLLSDCGFTNVDWRKGTPLDASPADRGRDIVAITEREDADGHRYRETWFVDCKHYKRGVPPDALQSTITWAQAERPSTVLFLVSGYLTNGAKDWISTFEVTRPPFRIRVWELPQIRRLLSERLDLAFKHDVEIETLRKVSDILKAEDELVDRLWYGRKPYDDDPQMREWEPETVEAVKKAKREVEAKYGQDVLDKDVASDWAWGYLSGKVAAIRWVLGYEWDMLDS